MAEKNGSDDRVWMYVRKDGSCVPVRVVVTPVRDEHNAIQGYLGIAVDITTTQLVEEQLRHAKTTAEMANELKSRFLAHMSHEIRTPLAAIIGVAEIQEEEARSERDRKAASLIIANGRHLLELINGILDLSKIEAGRLEIESIVCHPSCLVRDAAELLRLQAKQKGLDLQVELDPSLSAPVITDPTRLRQILLNLMGNAIKFTPSGRVIVRGTQEIRDDQTPWLILDVIDTGIGLDQEQIRRLFQPFEQADTSTTRRFGGTGWACPCHSVWPNCWVEHSAWRVLQERGAGLPWQSRSNPLPPPPNRSRNRPPDRRHLPPGEDEDFSSPKTGRSTSICCGTG